MGLLDPNQMLNPQTQGLLGLGQGLLQSSGWSPTPISMGQAMGQGLQSGLSAYTGAQQQQLENQLAQAKLAKGGTDRGYASGRTVITEDAKGNKYYTVSNLNKTTGETTLENIPIGADQSLVSTLGETPGEIQSRAIATKEGETSATKRVSRWEGNLSRGFTAADSTATLRRAIKLNDLVKTGGIDNTTRLAIKNFFGVESGDEGELSNLMGKAVLSQLRETFGSAFTAEEGKGLTKIEAGFGKNPTVNARLLNNALRMAERIARRGARSARNLGDMEAAADIENALKFTLDSFQGGDSKKDDPLGLFE